MGDVLLPSYRSILIAGLGARRITVPEGTDAASEKSYAETGAPAELDLTMAPEGSGYSRHRLDLRQVQPP